MAAPQLLTRKQNGAATQASASGDTSKTSRRKTAQEGNKVVVRRLPSGMTEDEFISILGDAWKVGKGKVTWLSYNPGKVSQHPSRPSRPSRAYLNVLNKDDLLALSQAVQTAVWEDAKETYNDPSLVLPPTVELSIYKKIPSDKKRTDSRQGTIDQDPDFMAFLEGLANPDAGKEGDADASPEEDSPKADKTTTTPLIEYLREKKAARVKEAAAARSARHARQDSQGGKPDPTPSASESSRRRGRETRDSKQERSSDKPRESVKILTKKAAADAAVEAAKAVATQIQASSSSSTQEALPKSRRAGIAAAARILQRDLGLSPGNAHRKARQDAAKAEAEAKASSSKEPAKEAAPAPKEPPAPPSPVVERPASPAPAKATSSSTRSRNRKRAGGGGTEETLKPKPDAKGERSTESAPQNQAPTKGPVILMKKKDKEQAPAVAASSTSQPSASTSSNASKPTPPIRSKATPPPASKSVATPPPANEAKATLAKQGPSGKKGSGKSDATPSASTGATKAFIKRANPSQGVTDSTLREAMQAFGSVTSVEMDRKKGFAYVDFADHESLVKAMAASPVAVGQANVQVVERKDMGKKTGGGGGGGSSGGKAAATPSKDAVGGTFTASGEASASASQPAQAPSGSEPSAQAGSSSTPTPGEKTGGERRGGRRRGGRGKDKDSSAAGGKSTATSGGGGGSSAAGQSSK